MLVIVAGTECKKQFDLLTAEKKPEVKVEIKAKEEPKETVVPPVAPPPPAPPPSVIKRENSSNSLDTAEEHFFNANGHVGVDGPFSYPPPAFPVPPPAAEYGYGAGWQPPFWNQTGASWLSQQPQPETSNLTNNHVEEEEPEKVEEESTALDLDSRIELLLRGKISAALNTPAFLQLPFNDGSSNSGSSRSSSRAGNEIKREPCSSPPLSPPPSPFLSQEIYLEHHKAAHPEPQRKNNYQNLVAVLHILHIYLFLM